MKKVIANIVTMQHKE